MHGRADPQIGAAAAQIPIHGGVDIFIAGVRIFGEQRGRRHHLARLTITALCDVEFLPRHLDRVSAVRRKPFHRRNGLGSNRRNWRLTRRHGLAIQMHGARTALPDTAAVLRAAKVQKVPDHP